MENIPEWLSWMPLQWIYSIQILAPVIGAIVAVVGTGVAWWRTRLLKGHIDSTADQLVDISIDVQWIKKRLNYPQDRQGDTEA